MRVTFGEVRDNLRQRIIEGEWARGELIPNEADLAEAFGCARATVNRAVQALADEGLVERRRKAGTRVRERPRRHATFEIPVLRQEIEAAGMVYGFSVLAQAVTRPPAWVAERLGQEAREVRHIRCLHRGDGGPYVFEDRWINLAAIPAAREVDFAAVPPSEWLIAAVPFSDAEISFGAAAADAETAETLGAEAGAALFRIERTTWWEGQTVTHVQLTYRPGYKLTTRY